MSDLITVRQMTPDDLDVAQVLQRAEKWNQTLSDWQLFLDENPEGCFVAVSGKPGAAEQVVGTITSICYGRRWCWISMLLVNSEWRGAGIGTKLMKAVMTANERSCDCLRLDATPAGRPVYERLGFTADYELQRWKCPAERLDGPGMAGPEGSGASAEDACRPLDLARFREIRRDDTKLFGADRRAVLGRLYRDDPGCAWCIESEGAAVSYVLGRAGDRYHHVGPLVARTAGDALHLLKAAIKSAGRADIAVDLVEPQPELVREMEALGFVYERPFTRMSRGPSGDPARTEIIAAVGPEFG